VHWGSRRGAGSGVIPTSWYFFGKRKTRQVQVLESVFLGGRIIVLPSHPAYDRLHTIWNAMIERRPGLDRNREKRRATLADSHMDSLTRSFSFRFFASMLLCSLRVSRFKEVGRRPAFGMELWSSCFLGVVVKYQLVGIHCGKKLDGFGN
jgi:hypothetical protein